ncbi:MAG: AAA family ATPase [Bacteroides sp]|nr:AAA family ATPase [Bacteroides sp.]
MIQEIKIKNFRSFKDEVTFSFEASNDKFAEDSQVVQINENTRLLRFAIVYGYNASGKSNLLDVFEFLYDFWFYKPKDMDVKTGTIPFKLDKSSPTEPTKIELVFYVEDTKYSYLLELDEHQVYLEKLSYYKSVQPTKLFERRLENGQSVIDFNLKISNIVKEKITVECLKNMSFFAARKQVNASIPEIDAAMAWMTNKVHQTISPSTNLTKYAQRMTSKDNELIAYILDFLREADFNITNFKTDAINQPYPEEVVEMVLGSDKLSEEEKEIIKQVPFKKDFRTDFEHTVENERGVESYILTSGYGEESRGTLRTLGIETALYSIMKENAFVAIDEIETSFHPKLLEKILFEYLRTHSRSQLLVTTHNDGLLDLVDDLIRKDSVWFTEKKKSGVTDLYKLTDFRGVNRLSSIREAYRNKRFGATMN